MYKLTIEGLHKSYGDHQVLKGVSLKANTGDVISLIGASGSGKSTFLRCINFLEQPNDGAMSLDGQAIRMVKDRHGMHVADPDELQRIRTRLAMVFQHFNLWSHMTVLENITMAPRRVLGAASRKPKTAPAIWTRLAWQRGWRTNIRRSSPAASNSGWPLPGRWRWSRRSCCSMNRPRHSTRSWWVRCYA
jgi:ABC-type histidine transport system ATPase subunit